MKKRALSPSTCNRRSFMQGIRWIWVCLILGIAGMTSGQQLDQLSTAELYSLIAEFEMEGRDAEKAEAYTLIAERDLSEVGNLDRAIKNYIEAQKLFRRAGDSARMYDVIADLGRLYCGSEYYVEAIEMFDRVESYASRIQDSLLQARMLQQIAEIYLARNMANEGAEYFKKASHINLALQDTLLSNVNLLTIYALKGQRPWFADPPDSLDLDLSRYDSIRYQSFLPSIHLHVGMYNMYQKKYRLALYYLTQGLALAGNDVFVKRELYKKQAECYEKMDDISSALQVMKTFNAFNDSLSYANKTASIQQLLISTNKLQRDSEFRDLELDRNLSVFKGRMQKVFSVALIVAAVIMLIVSYIIIRTYQERLNSNQIITKQNEEINERKINELENNLKIETMSSMLQGQEVERERIARDLHDSLGGLLSTVKLHFDAIQAKYPEITNQKEYEKAYSLLDAACNEVRTISNNMQPGALMKMGIVPAIRDLINRIESEETPHIEFIHYGAVNDLPMQFTLHLYRITQELLYNSIKHAQANEILIQLIRNDEDMEIMVEDDGRGYNPNDVKKGMGTENVAARVNFLKGEISVYSETGVGTTTTITIPCEKQVVLDTEVEQENLNG